MYIKMLLKSSYIYVLFSKTKKIYNMNIFLNFTKNKIKKRGRKVLNTFVRVIIIYLLVLIVMRLMGKREIRPNATF